MALSGEIRVSVFDRGTGHEQVSFWHDPDSGLRAIIAVYSTALGPALGGTRFYPYPTEDDALSDVLNLSKAMAYKAACAGLDLGGGKAVILGNPSTDKTEALLRSYGRFVQSLGGRYYTACDVNRDAIDRVRVLHPEVDVVDVDALVDQPMDVYAPCALGGALSDEVVAILVAQIVCGAANNQLGHPGIEKQLEDRGILYAPDYVVNSGGLIQVADEIEGYSEPRARAKATEIFDTTLRIFALAAEEGVPPAVAADRLAERRMTGVGRLRRFWLHP